MIRIIRSAAVIAAICVFAHTWAQEPESASAWNETASWAIQDYDVGIIRDGSPEQSGYSDREFEAMVVAELPTATLVETVASEFNGCDWVRNIYWRRGEFILVSDRLHVREADNYVFASNWKVLSEADHEVHDGRVLTIERPEDADGVPPARVTVKGDGHARGTFSEQTDDAGNRSMLMRWELEGQLEAGETRAFHTLYYEEGEPEPRNWDLRRISDEAVLILRDGEPETVVVMGEEADIPGQVRMRMGAFGRRSIWAADLSNLRDLLRTARPIHGEVRADPTTHATVIGPPDVQTISVVGMPLMLQDGRLELDLAAFGDLSMGLVELDALFDSFARRALDPPQPG